MGNLSAFQYGSIHWNAGKPGSIGAVFPVSGSLGFGGYGGLSTLSGSSVAPVIRPEDTVIGAFGITTGLASNKFAIVEPSTFTCVAKGLVKCTSALGSFSVVCIQFQKADDKDNSVS